MLSNIHVDRIVPVIPHKSHQLRTVIDSDVGNEIDDLYAISLAIATPERFNIKPSAVQIIITAALNLVLIVLKNPSD